MCSHISWLYSNVRGGPCPLTISLLFTTIQICIPFMVNQETNFNDIYKNIITNSFFTERQISIISKRLIGKNKMENISSGAYYRHLKQCQDKVISLLYSVLLLRSIRAVDEQAFSIIDELAAQIAVMLVTEKRDIYYGRNMQSVISVLEQIIKRMSKV
jgi:hypothetical protein